MSQQALALGSAGAVKAISPLREMGAYEALWLEHGVTFKRLAEKFRSLEGSLPSSFVSESLAMDCAQKVLDRFAQKNVRQFGLRVHRAGDYPQKLRDATEPVELLYCRGYWDLVDTKCVAVVGTRNPTEAGIKRTKKLVRELVADGWTVVSGLATGVDTTAHATAIEAEGRTIAVIGTPISESYPPGNEELQERIAREFLVVSQVPVLRYGKQSPRGNRNWFPERNKTMSALTAATIIVEAGNTSGTLIQARAALAQKRKLFILDSCFRNPELTWPAKFAAKGAIRVQTYEQIRSALVDSKAD
ncbi:MAG TPA: DNA-processing protein DprA [Polyangiales bacterium]|nr:DNA-processing protein DprA [Polyangiales bacterium]